MPKQTQLIRFCLYGFLKNLQFFEPFLILALRDKGFSFLAIGTLMAFRAVMVNTLEIPSGAMADVLGRRRSMIASFLAYMASFVIFALADAYWAFFPAMACFAVGEAFRTGTHKAMIFHWLTRQNRQDEKTKIYGLTRSWSKQGSALNAILGAAILIVTKDYRWVFLLATIPFAANIVNMMGYPAYLDGEKTTSRGIRSVLSTLHSGLSLSMKRHSLRSLILENVCFEGIFSVSKDFLQPTLQASAVVLPLLTAWSADRRTAVLIALVYTLLHLLSSAASRFSHHAVTAAGGETPLVRRLWGLNMGLYALMGIGFFLNWSILAIGGFVCLALAFNIWKPLLVSRFHDRADLDSAATTLSIANQSKTLSVVVLAPSLGWAVDRLSGPLAAGQSIDLFSLWPLAVAGVVAGIIGITIHLRGSTD